MSFSIAGKTAIVTGAANGIGLAVARHFVAQGANVMFVDMDEARLTEEVGEAAAQEDSGLRLFVGDLRKKLTLANLLSATIDAFDRIDILVNASRQIVPTEPLNPDDTSLDAMIEQNLMTSYRLSQVIARKMIAQAEKDDEIEGQIGSIINLSSIAAAHSHPDLLAYSVSTAAVEQMTRSLALALAHRGVRVNAISFGSVMSSSLRDAMRDDVDLRDNVVRSTPLGRIAGATELAETAQYLASDASGFVTGQVLVVDGGRCLVDTVGAPSH